MNSEQRRIRGLTEYQAKRELVELARKDCYLRCRVAYPSPKSKSTSITGGGKTNQYLIDNYGLDLDTWKKEQREKEWMTSMKAAKSSRKGKGKGKGKREIAWMTDVKAAGGSRKGKGKGKSKPKKKTPPTKPKAKNISKDTTVPVQLTKNLSVTSWGKRAYRYHRNKDGTIMPVGLTLRKKMKGTVFHLRVIRHNDSIAFECWNDKSKTVYSSVSKKGHETTPSGPFNESLKSIGKSTGPSAHILFELKRPDFIDTLNKYHGK